MYALGKDAEAQCDQKDRYKRDVCIIRVAGRDVGLEQRLGWLSGIATRASMSRLKRRPKQTDYGAIRRLSLREWRHSRGQA
jgi:hypothetical protein